MADEDHSWRRDTTLFIAFWIAFMSGATSIVREVLGLFFPQAVPASAAFRSSAIICFVLSGLFVLFRQRRTINQLSKRNKEPSPSDILAERQNAKFEYKKAINALAEELTAFLRYREDGKPMPPAEGVDNLEEAGVIWEAQKAYKRQTAELLVSQFSEQIEAVKKYVSAAALPVNDIDTFVEIIKRGNYDETGQLVNHLYSISQSL